MHFRHLPFGWGLMASLAAADPSFLVNELSFGYGNRIHPEHTNTIPHFLIQGTPHMPELLSNKIILTPPAPGNQRAAIWGEKTLEQTEWVADVDFRASGPERAGGNLNIWLVKDGLSHVQSSSIYTVGRFEGLALVIDTHGGYGGMVRAFLNDGTTDYKVAQVDTLSFGHCNYGYRNLGRPTQVKLRQTSSNFRVELDGHLCFESNAVRIPTGYGFGVSAASADNPDSFEIFKLVVMTEQPHQSSGGSNNHDQHNSNQPHDSNPPSKFSRSGGSDSGSGNNNYNNWEKEWEKDLPDAAANTITGSKEQFEDIHNRLQSISHHLLSVFHSQSALNQVGEHRHEEVSRLISDVRTTLHRLDALSDLERKIDQLQADLLSLKSDLGSRVEQSAQSIKYHVSDHHETLAQKVKDAAPGHGRLIFIIVAGQVVLVGVYIMYKRRRTSSSKKYL